MPDQLLLALLRLPFIYGDQDGHLESLPTFVEMLKWHPANKLSMIHHRDIADEAPQSIYEICELVGEPMAPSSRPLEHPWSGHADGALARGLGFTPAIATIYQAQREGVL